MLIVVSRSLSTPGPTAQAKKTPPTSGSTTTEARIPVPPMLGPVPQNCPASNPPRQVISLDLSEVIGTSLLWVTWTPGEYRGPSLSQYPGSFVPPYGWEMTIVTGAYQHVYRIS
jgi:hypothetical protein